MITLTTDFGDSAYVGAMKGAILRRNPAARIVDVTHAVPAQDVVAGALALHAAAPHFPEGTVHVAVVDPGVGTARRGLCVVTRGGLLIGPDNGLLIPAAREMGLLRVHALANPALWAPRVAPTFHGRDVFGPVAAALDGGLAVEEVGPTIEDWRDATFGGWREADGGLEGTVLALDPFGNAITNLPGAAVENRWFPGMRLKVHVGEAAGVEVSFRRTYGESRAGETLVLPGSSGFLEVAINQGNAARALGVRPGDRVRMQPAP